MDLRYLQLFCRVVELGSFSLAAEEMHITQPAASQQVRTIERQLKAVLLDRSGREVTATDAGTVLYRHAKHMLDQFELAQQQIGDLGELMAGRISIGGATGPGEHILPRLIADFRDRYPAVTVSLRVADTQEIIDEVLSRHLEVGVVGAVMRERELVVRPLAKDEIVIICAPDHRWAGRDDVSLSELLREPLIVQQRGAGVRAVFEEALRGRGLRERDLNIAFEMGLNESAKQGVMAGAGVTYISKFAISSEVEAGTLALARLADFEVDRHFSYVHARRRTLSHAANAFLAYLEERSRTLV
jgi:DNA-binding transcriptional LysR family regulator